MPRPSRNKQPWKPLRDENDIPVWDEIDALLSARKVQAIFCMDCVETIYTWRDTGKLRGYKVNGLLRFKKADVRALYEESLCKTG